MTAERPDALVNQTRDEVELIERTPSAYGYPLLIKHLDKKVLREKYGR